jgi:peptidoglycan/LPS O-acetylase OafA/YrhL
MTEGESRLTASPTESLEHENPMRHHVPFSYRPDIDGLRGVAVLSVLGFHAFPSLAKGGFVGVDIFFVISGYLISGIIIADAIRGQFSFLRFYVRRIRRIFPALIVLLLFCMVYGWLFLLPHDYAELGVNAAGGAGFISNFVLFAQSGYFAAASDTRPLLHLWSLGVEEQYYLFWPLLLWLSCRFRSSALALTIVLALASFVWNVAKVSADPVATFYLPQTRFWELLMGAALAASAGIDARRPDRGGLGQPENPTPRFAAARSIVGALLVCMALVVINETRRFPGWWAVIPTTGSLLMISAGPTAWLNRRVLSNRGLVWFGLISYPLYLWHWPLIALTTLHQGEFPSRNSRIIIVLASIALAWITYVAVERPIRYRKNGTQKAVALLAIMAATGFLGYRCFEMDGHPERFPKIVQDIDALAYKNDHEAAWRQGSCFLELDQTAASFAACDPALIAGDKPILLIWGDSLAAQLYPGYASVYGDKFAVMQRTASACGPIFDDAYNSRLPNCNAINADVLRLIERLKPQRVVLAARWSVHDWRKVVETIGTLRAAGVKKVDLVGPVPRWKSSLPRQLILFVQSTRADAFPARMKLGLEPGVGDIEPDLRRICAQNDVTYLSPLSILCNESGCLTRTGNTVNSISSFDYDHLSPAASIFVVERFPTD